MFNKKVCILTTAHSALDIRIFYKQAKTLANGGYDVTLVAQHEKDELVDRVKIIALPKPKNRLQRMLGLTQKVLQEAFKCKADIYHFHDPELLPIGLLLKRQGKRLIYDVHEDVPRQNLSKSYIPILFRKPISALIEALEDFSARRFDGVITATPFINKRFLGLGAKAVNVNNYPIVSELSPTENQWKRKEKAVCYVGGIAEIRGAFEMVEAIGKIGYKLFLGGEIESNIEKKLKEMPGWQNVKTLGFLDRNAVKSTLSRSMGGLVLFHPEPNHIEAQPNKMFEYMSAGIPVIASNFPLWKEIVEGTKCGICVDPLNPKEIADAIRWIIEHRREAQAMGQNGRRSVVDKYNWERESKKLLMLYEELFKQ